MMQRKAQPNAPRTAIRPRVRSAAMALAAAACTFAAQAQAQDGVVAATPDPLLTLLQQRGVVPATAAALRQVRDATTETVLAALAFLDLPYLQGGTSALAGFDCSGFTRHVFGQALGLWLPRSAEQQAHDNKLVSVPAQELQPGDLVFFNTMRKAFSHVGIYVGEGRFVHSPRQGAQVRVENMRQAYWSQRFDGARRVSLADKAQPVATGLP